MTTQPQGAPEPVSSQAVDSAPQQAPHQSGNQATQAAPIPLAADKTSKGFTNANIAVLSIVGLVSILIMLFGEFEGKGVRVFGTLLLFAAFTGFSAYDGRKRDRPQYIQIAMVGNIYLVALGLLLIWGTMALETWYFHEEIIFRLFFLIILARAGLVLLQFAAKFAESPEKGLQTAASISAIAIAITLVLYTLPIALDPFFTFVDFYWRVAVAMMLVSVLAISVGILVYWANREPRENQVRAQGTQNANQQNSQHLANQQSSRHEVPGAVWNEANAPQKPSHEPQRHGHTSAPVAPENGAQAYAAPVAAAMPWPVFPSGQPLPTLPNGRPDYQALQYMASVFVESERQWFSGK